RTRPPGLRHARQAHRHKGRLTRRAHGLRGLRWEVTWLAMTPEEAGQVFVDAGAHADPERFHEACALLRREAPVQRVEHPDFNPFYAVTRHADVMEVESHPEAFHNAPRPILQTIDADRFREAQGDVLRTLIHMDDPDHRRYRAV